MTERQGLYTLQISLALTQQGRERLVALARAQPLADLADIITTLIGDEPFDTPPPAEPPDVAVRLPVRIYLSAEQRAALAAATDAEAVIAQRVAAALAALPPPEPPPPASPPRIDRQRLRAAIAELRDRRARDGADAPAWIDPYIAQLEEQLRGL